jgi:hypothetical protein
MIADARVGRAKVDTDNFAHDFSFTLLRGESLKTNLVYVMGLPSSLNSSRCLILGVLPVEFKPPVWLWKQ